MISNKHIWILLLTCLIMTLFSFYLHIVPGTNTMINYVGENQPRDEKFIVTDGFLPWAVNYHHFLLEFKKRPIAVFLMEKYAQLFNVRISLAYVFVNFFFLFLGGLLIYYLSYQYKLKHNLAILSMISYFLSFAILLAYSIPIATLDEPVQYFFILLSFIALNKQKNLVFIIFFTLAIITRETSLLLLPIIVLFFMDVDLKKLFQQKNKLVKVCITSGLPILFYVLYSVWFYKQNPQLMQETETLLGQKFLYYKTKNFLDFENSIRTILSIISVNLVPIFLIFYYKTKHQYTAFESKLLIAFWITFSINFVMVMLSAYAEESRVFTLPFLILFPIYGKIIDGVIRFNKRFLTYLITWKPILIILLTVILSWLLFKLGYKLTNFKPHENLNLYVEYNTLSVFFIVLVLLYSRFSAIQKPQQ